MLIPASQRPAIGAARKDRRLRALYRRELRESVRAASLILVAAGAIPIAIMALRGAAQLPLVAMVDGPLTVVSLALCFLARRARRHITVLGIVAGLVPVAALAWVPFIEPSQTAIVVGALGAVPLAFTLFVPLEPRPHGLWLALATALLCGFVLAAGPASPLWHEAPPLFTIWLLVASLSLIASRAQGRRRQVTDRQILASRALYARMQEHQLDLRRQDEFLLMQQETLVVQQAELLRLNEELESIARLDALTSLGNRLRLNEDLAQLAGRIERSGGTFGLLLLDLDRFKRLNDSAGHLAGDGALRGVADVLRRTSRIGDGLYRYGGEEFLVVLHDCDEQVLLLAGQRYIAAIQAAGILHPDNAPWGVVTASAGASELSQRTGADVDSALRAADEALYRAKANGRNRLEVHVIGGVVPLVSIDRQLAAS